LIGLDTNILLRILLRDDELHTSRARRLLEREGTRSGSLFVNRICLCEAVWTMTRSARLSRQRVAEIIEVWLATPALVIEDRETVQAALQLFRASRLDFADALLGLLNAKAGCTATYSFDEAGISAGVFTAVPAA
jgi:predicted nucleic-acid-binding protein